MYVQHSSHRAPAAPFHCAAIALGLAILSSSAFASAPVFRLPFCFGTGALGMVSEDLNGDANPDLVTVASWGGTALYFGNGQGGFGERIDLDVVGCSMDVGIGDFNGDGHHDIVVMGSGCGSGRAVSVLFGNGGGSFGGRVDSPGIGGQSFAVADLNGDGLSDLAMSDYGLVESLSVSAMLSDGDGTFTVSQTIATPAAPYGVATGDFNVDGKPDIAVANSNFSISVIRNIGDGHFAAPVNYLLQSFPRFIESADMNGDTFPDLVTANENGVSVFLGNGDATFQPRVPYPGTGEGWGLTLADFTHDGLIDVAVAVVSEIVLFRNTGGGALAVLSHIPAGAFGITAADFDRDGAMDCSYGGLNLNGLMLGATADEPFVSHTVQSVPGSNMEAALGDVSGDGILDLIVPGGGTSVMLGHGDGEFHQVAGGLTNQSTTYGVAAGDLDHDGDVDLAVTHDLSGVLSIVKNLGNGTFAQPVEYQLEGPNGLEGTGVRTIVMGDLNNDGAPDLVLPSIRFTWIVVMLNDGTGAFQRTTYLTGPWPSRAAIGDVTGDGVPDVVTANRNNNTISIHRNLGNGTFAAKTDLGAGAEPLAVAIGDIDRDGDGDIAIANSWGGGTVTLRFATGGGIFTRLDFTLGGAPQAVTIADFNRDGYQDVALANPGNKTLWTLLGHGGYPYELQTFFAGEMYSLAAGDVNEDGALDLAGASGNAVNLVLNSNLFTTGVDPSQVVTRLALATPRPNPATAAVSLDLTLPASSRVDAHVLDVSGRSVRSLARGTNFGPGQHTLAWDRRDDRGRRLAPGVYLMVVTAGGERAARRIVLVD